MCVTPTCHPHVYRPDLFQVSVILRGLATIHQPGSIHVSVESHLVPTCLSALKCPGRRTPSRGTHMPISLISPSSALTLICGPHVYEANNIEVGSHPHVAPTCLITRLGYGLNCSYCNQQCMTTRSVSTSTSVYLVNGFCILRARTCEELFSLAAAAVAVCF